MIRRAAALLLALLSAAALGATTTAQLSSPALIVHYIGPSTGTYTPWVLAVSHSGGATLTLRCGPTGTERLGRHWIVDNRPTTMIYLPFPDPCAAGDQHTLTLTQWQPDGSTGQPVTFGPFSASPPPFVPTDDLRQIAGKPYRTHLPMTQRAPSITPLEDPHAVHP